MLRKAIRYALVQLSHPFIEKLFTESNVIYGGEGDLNMFNPRPQVLNCDCDIRFQVLKRDTQSLVSICDCDAQVMHPVEDARPDRRRGCTPSSVFFEIHQV
jgi:hypothetical protein